MPASDTWRSFARVVAAVCCGLALFVSCAKDPVRVDRNRPPRTFLVAAPAESASASYRIHLYWRGEDPDGYIAGFLWAWDDSSISAFRFTSKTDSSFELNVNDSSLVAGGTGQQQPGTVRPHTFFIRAVDNLGKQDPSLTIFNRRVYNASTLKPSVQFVGAIPSGVGIDTLCDGQPFKVCWTGSDEDGYVAYYRYDIGPFSSPLVTDTCAYFNDPSVPSAVPLTSGVYTLTVTAIDNAFAPSDPGGGKILMVVNRDPETWILPRGGTPRGHFIQPFLKGQPTMIEGTFAPGDTVPFRSTVWWEWDGEDAACEKDTCLTGWSITLSQGTRNGGDPYIIGFIDQLSAGPPPLRFKTNNPDVLGPLNFTNQILDSLDAGYNMLVRVTSRDCSNRTDGTPASFVFNCNFTPRLDSLSVADTTLASGALAKVFRWVSEDYEDGLTKTARLTLDGTSSRTLDGFETSTVIPESEFIRLSSSNPHTLDLEVRDRAGIVSPTRLSVQFNVTYPP